MTFCRIGSVCAPSGDANWASLDNSLSIFLSANSKDFPKAISGPLRKLVKVVPETSNGKDNHRHSGREESQSTQLYVAKPKSRQIRKMKIAGRSIQQEEILGLELKINR